ncbi:MAG: hypothetical protein P5693_26345, partial [Limnospira sp. PMC 1290.21]|uniref:hypothetical protein n=1 Tax=Limnospira sp. PMC 1290.21 TaxID=2981073 RepID=UPI0028E15CAC
ATITPEVLASLQSDVVAIYANTNAFAALKSDGSVVTWGTGGGGNYLDVYEPRSSRLDEVLARDQLTEGIVGLFSPFGTPSETGAGPAPLPEIDPAPPGPDDSGSDTGGPGTGGPGVTDPDPA